MCAQFVHHKIAMTTCFVNVYDSPPFLPCVLVCSRVFKDDDSDSPSVLLWLLCGEDREVLDKGQNSKRKGVGGSGSGRFLLD